MGALLLASTSASALIAGVPQAASAQEAPAAQRLTPERVFANPDLNGPRARGVALSPDGALVTYLRARDDDQSVTDLWAARVDGGAPFRLIDANALNPDAELSEAEKARRERQRITTRGVVEYAWDDQGRFVLVPVQGDLFLYERAAERVVRLTETPGDEVDAKVSPRGGFVSYVRDQNLYLRPVGGGAERAITTEGGGALSFGVAEFVAQEEMERTTGYWWSPDETRIAFTRVDESGVDVIPRFDIGASGVSVVEQRYPRAGRPNAKVELFVQALSGGAPVKVDLGPDADVYLARADWSKDGRTLFVQRQSRDQTRLDLLAVDPATGAARVVLTETSPHWVELHKDFRPLSDGSFLWSSERSGHRRLYLYRADGRLIRQVTQGAWPVDAVEAVDEARGLVLFSASKDTPIERRLYAVSYKRPGEPRALTSAGGWWTATVARNAAAFAGTYSDPSTPPRTGLYDREGRLVRWIEENRLDASHPYAPFVARHTVPEYGTVAAEDGQPMHYSLLKPADFDPSRRYPAIVVVYGGPGVQRVTRGWQSLNERLFVEAGYLVFRMDNRGSSNRSTAFKTAIDGRLGVVETADQLRGVEWLKRQPFVDADRLGVYGWSYGGTMTLRLLTEPNTPFRAGVSGAPVTDWTLYDTHYTERFMETPQANPQGYADTSLITRLPQLNGELMLIHGMADDNVTFDNSTRVMGALQQASVPFETMVYPGERHGVRPQPKQLHLWRTMLGFFERRLQPRTEASR